LAARFTIEGSQYPGIVVILFASNREPTPDSKAWSSLRQAGRVGSRYRNFNRSQRVVVSRHLNRPVKQDQLIGHDAQFGGCLPLMEDTTMRVKSLVMPTHYWLKQAQAAYGLR
jgi:antirestriction protein ArdC